MAAYDIRAASPWAPMRTLSGGNQQRVVLARELEPPTGRPRRRPADAGPRRRRHRVHVDPAAGRRADGIGVLLISTELDEILDLADRVVVLSPRA